MNPGLNSHFQGVTLFFPFFHEKEERGPSLLGLLHVTTSVFEQLSHVTSEQVKNRRLDNRLKPLHGEELAADGHCGQ